MTSALRHREQRSIAVRPNENLLLLVGTRRCSWRPPSNSRRVSGPRCSQRASAGLGPREQNGQHAPRVLLFAGPLPAAAQERMSVDALIALYFASHFVLGYLVDIQSVLPDVSPALYAKYEAAGLTAVVQRWGEEQGDFLVLSNPLWFKSVIWFEVTLQLPACALIAYGWANRREWVKTPALVYSVHVLTTMVPIMAVLYFDPRPTIMCLAVYGIWVALPLLVAARCLAAGDGRLFFRSRDYAEPPKGTATGRKDDFKAA